MISTKTDQGKFRDEHRGFTDGNWTCEVDVRNFILSNITPYTGDESFLEGCTPRTQNLFEKVEALLELEASRDGVLDIDVDHVSSLLSYEPGYIQKEDEIIVGLQTDEPLKRGVNPFGGIRMATQACEAYGKRLSEEVLAQFDYKTTHNEGVFRVYTDEMKTLRRSGVITGLPDAYGRGRIIGDYRRIALYGMDYLIEQKKADKACYAQKPMLEENIRQVEELYKQIDFLNKMIEMAKAYGDDIRKPAKNTREAVQWIYYGYLASIKEQNGAAMSLGRVSSFIDIYAERDLKEGIYSEIQIQEIMDDFVIKLRLARQLRTPDYNQLFAGDPLWITEAIGGISVEGKPLVTKNSFRFLHTLTNLGPAPEPNMTVLWSEKLPEAFKKYCAKISILTDAIQYENDDIMKPVYGDDYGIACCVSAMKLGKEMQFFGARCNLAKTLLMALNGGHDEKNFELIGPQDTVMDDEVLDFDKVWERYDRYLDWICEKYVNTLNIIHFMHDKYAYEKTQMALHDTEVHRFMAFGIAGLSVAADSLSAIKYAKVKPVLNARGFIEDFITEGSFPCYGNDDDRVDAIAVKLTENFIEKLRKHPTYRNATHSLSVLTITSNVVYGKKTGSTPDGRKSGEPFAPGANPMHNRDLNGALASLNSVAKIPYDACRDGISCTFSITPSSLGADMEVQKSNLVTVLDGYFYQKAHHLNVNVLDRNKLIEAMASPNKYPNLTIRVSGYAVHFHRLSREQQLEVINRTFHTAL
ncbi:formate C-acetyltransferase [Fusibacter ferrireducens]|uniref:Formate acetyltransferase n=1 Tax=Fusibacter ferrireducens TaxID=2785058 RepID=A0ABR9ZT29_9FIRM|nr:formate C-acetyltransferase [Fusibacter ferrireducens]MBF4693614.1 formate C-acetyltransferase [Fusibacter ferrireducens]